VPEVYLETNVAVHEEGGSSRARGCLPVQPREGRRVVEVQCSGGLRLNNKEAVSFPSPEWERKMFDLSSGVANRWVPQRSM
jgi:hypothetical protein